MIQCDICLSKIEFEQLVPLRDIESDLCATCYTTFDGKRSAIGSEEHAIMAAKVKERLQLEVDKMKEEGKRLNG